MTASISNSDHAPSPTKYDSSIRAGSRKNRVFCLRDFLTEAYGSLYLQQGVILDVAGGKGDLSWLLLNVDSVASVVTDPRVTKNHLVRSVEFLRQHPEEAAARAIPGRPTHQPLAALIPKLHGKETFASPQHLRILVDQDLVDAVREVRAYQSTTNTVDKLERMKQWHAYWQNALHKGRQVQPSLGYQQDLDLAENQITDAQVALDTILRTTLVVGFHPDQATDACMDLAILLNIPYCIVPCCVFPCEFPHRQRPDGCRVRCYEELIVYLQKKDARARLTLLPFHDTATARNVALYTLPSDCHQE
jgi:hypothetical protein